MHYCDMCNVPLAMLGQLGMLVWLRCPGCGLEYSVPADDLDLNESEDY